jgi:hypothetical protein
VQISESSGKAAERRIAPRTKLVEIAYIGVGSENGGLVLDVSDGGLSFHAVAPFKPAEKVEFLLSLRGHSRIEGTGEVVWTNQMGTVCGLKFTSLSAGALEFLNNWTNQSNAPRPAKKAPVPETARPITAPPTQIATPRMEAAPDVQASQSAFSSKPIFAIPPAAEIYLSEPTGGSLRGGQFFLWVVFGFLGTTLLASAYFYGVHVGQSKLSNVDQTAVISGLQTEPPIPAPAPDPAASAASDRPSVPNDAKSAPTAPVPVSVPVPVPNNAAPVPSSTLGNAAKTASHSGSTLVGSEGEIKNPAADPDAHPKQASEGGKSEFSAALARLNGDNGTRDTSAAVKLLWAAIAKGNTAAEVTLADLYVYGDGVQQNCEQGKSLLNAAS